MTEGLGEAGGPRALPEVTVYTDGGADPNPGPGGWGVVLVHPASGRSEELRGGEPHTTNNRMELTAALKALETLKQRCRVQLYTDSQYLRRGVTEWLPGWIARGWKRKTGELQNEDLWRRLAAAVTLHQISWHWVKGHAGHTHNERADRLASAAVADQRAALRQRRAAAAAAGGVVGAGGAGGAAAAPALPEIEVFLRISRSRQGAGWAALVRRPGAGAAAAGAAAGEAAGAAVAGGGVAAPGPGALGVAAGGSARTAALPPEDLVSGLGAAPGGQAGEAVPPPAPAAAGAGERIVSGRLPAEATVSANALDLLAAAAVLESLPAGARVAVHTGSDYLRHGASRWLPGWRQRGWRTKEGGAVMNRELWERLAAAMARRTVEWPEVKGSELPELESLGKAARAAAGGGDASGAAGAPAAANRGGAAARRPPRR